MSAPINEGGPAFPHFKFSENGKVEICPQGGMTLRDYFAAQALAGIISSDNKPEDDDNKAIWAYSLADVMLFYRKESNT